MSILELQYVTLNSPEQKSALTLVSSKKVVLTASIDTIFKEVACRQRILRFKRLFK
jgi:hypothetical protein